MKVLLALVALSLALALLSCEPRPTPRANGGHYEKFTTKDGLDCISWRDDKAGGLSCNWEAFNKKISQ